METTDVHESDIDQATLWNGVVGNAWVEGQALLDQVLSPIKTLLLEPIAAKPEGAVLDVGCGTGATTLAAAGLIGAEGRAVGIDISKPMIEAARERAQQEGNAAQFICGNAESHPFEQAGFDWVISRFGVMFFADPARAFANLRRAARRDARLRLIVWRNAEDNPFMTTAERAAAPFIADIPPREPSAPGQFAFADPRRVETILEQGGWSGVDIRPCDIACSFPESALQFYFTRLGPLGRVLHEADERTQARIIEAVRAAFDRYVRQAEVHFTAACWLVEARAL